MAVEADEKINPEAPYAALLQKVSCYAGLFRSDECRAGLKQILETPLRTIETLSVQGLARLHRRLWIALHQWSPDDPLKRQYEALLIGTGLAPTNSSSRFATNPDRSHRKQESTSIAFWSGSRLMRTGRTR